MKKDILTLEQEQTQKLLSNGSISKTELCVFLKVSRTTFRTWAIKANVYEEIRRNKILTFGQAKKILIAFGYEVK